MEIAMLVLTAVGVAAAIIAALPPLGVDIRIFGRPNMPLEGIPYLRAQQAWIAIVVALISLAVSAGAFYYFFRPRVVEKPVDRILEKIVPAQCPAEPPAKAKSAKPETTSDIKQHGDATGAVGGNVTQGPCSNLQIGGRGNQSAANCLPVQRHLSDSEKACLVTLAGSLSIPISVRVPTNGDQDFAVEISRVFQSKGKAEEFLYLLSAWPHGNFVQASSDTASTAAFLAAQLPRCGIPIRQSSQDDKLKPGQLLLIIGNQAQD
jgi:hypothetical protein